MVFHILYVFFLDSVNRSLYNDCFRAISRFINGILLSFLIFLHARCISEFCSISEWRLRYLKGQIRLTLKAAMGIFDYGVKTRTVEQRLKAMVFKKIRSSPLEIARKYQISKVNCSVNMSCMHAVKVHYKQ